MAKSDRERSKDAYQKKKDLGICVRGCGRDTDGYAACFKCRMKDSNHKKERKLKG